MLLFVLKLIFLSPLQLQSPIQPSLPPVEESITIDIETLKKITQQITAILSNIRAQDSTLDEPTIQRYLSIINSTIELLQDKKHLALKSVDDALQVVLLAELRAQEAEKRATTAEEHMRKLAIQRDELAQLRNKAETKSEELEQRYLQAQSMYTIEKVKAKENKKALQTALGDLDMANRDLNRLLTIERDLRKEIRQASIQLSAAQEHIRQLIPDAVRGQILAHSKELLRIILSQEDKDRMFLLAFQMAMIWYDFYESVPYEIEQILLSSLSPKQAFKSKAAPARSLDFRPPDGRFLATSGMSGAVIWDTQTADISHSFIEPGAHIVDVSYSSDGDYLAAAALDGSVFVWSTQRNGRVRIYPPVKTKAGDRRRRSDYPEDVKLSFGVDSVIAVTDNSGVDLLGAFSGQHFATLSGHSANVSKVTFSHDGTHIATISLDRTARLWGNKGKELRIFSGHSAPIVDVAFNYNGTRLATAAIDSTVRVWDVMQGQRFTPKTVFQTELFRVELSPTFPQAVEFHPTMARLVIGCNDGTLQFWSTIDDMPIIKLVNSEVPVSDLDFSPDGKRLAALDSEGVIRIYTTEISDLFEEAKKRAATLPPLSGGVLEILDLLEKDKR